VCAKRRHWPGLACVDAGESQTVVRAPNPVSYTFAS
jgi:hypothetical protein